MTTFLRPTHSTAQLLGTALSLFLLQSCVSEVSDQEIFFEELPGENGEDFESPLPDDVDDGAEEVDPVVWSPVSEEYTGLTYPVPSLYGSVELPVQIQGENLVHGDMVVGTVDDLLRREAELEQVANGGLVALSNPRSNFLIPWPDHEIPYAIDSSIPIGDERRASIVQGVNRWNNQTQFLLRPRTEGEERTEGAYLKFIGNDDQTCSSDVGFKGFYAVTEVSLGVGCDAVNIIHEVGHAVGLMHEHQRPDRDEHIGIIWSAVVDGTDNWNFDIGGEGFGPYDFISRMHYNNFAFSNSDNPRRPTIIKMGCTTARPAECWLGRSAFSPGDTAGLRRIQDGTNPSRQTRYLNAHTGKCLRSSGDDMTPGEPLRQSSCLNSLSRRWYTGEVTTTRTEALVHRYSRLCVNRTGSDETLGACSSDPSNAFERHPMGDNIYKLVVSGWCLQASSGNNTHFAACDRGTDQLWQAMD